MKKRLYLIGGTMGVGKTTVGTALNRLLPRSVLLDGDWCWYADPFTVTQETKAMVMDNIHHLLGNFIACSAYDNIVFCWVMHEDSIIRDILKGLDTTCCEVKKISLICDAPTLCARLQNDIKNGIRNAEIVERSLERLPLYEALDTVKLDTTGKSVAEICAALAAL